MKKQSWTNQEELVSGMLLLKRIRQITQKWLYEQIKHFVLLVFHGRGPVYALKLLWQECLWTSAIYDDLYLPFSCDMRRSSSSPRVKVRALILYLIALTFIWEINVFHSQELLCADVQKTLRLYDRCLFFFYPNMCSFYVFKNFYRTKCSELRRLWLRVLLRQYWCDVINITVNIAKVIYAVVDSFRSNKWIIQCQALVERIN